MTNLKSMRVVGSTHFLAYPEKIHQYFSSRSPIPEPAKVSIRQLLKDFYVSRSTIKLKGLRGYDNPHNRLDANYTFYNDVYTELCGRREVLFVSVKVTVLECKFYEIKSAEDRIAMIDELIEAWMEGR